jgi:flagellar motor protein MotB
MKKVTKAIKALSNLNEEEKQEVAEYFKVDEETGEVKVAEKQEEKVEKKEVTKEVKKEDNDFEKKFDELNSKFETTVKELGDIKKKLEKSKAFGEKAKPTLKDNSNEFDALFTNILQNK